MKKLLKIITDHFDKYAEITFVFKLNFKHMGLRILILCFCLLAVSFLSYGQCISVTPSSPFSQNFEANNGGWTTGGTNSDWQWGTPAKTTISGAGGGLRCWIAGGLTNPLYEFDANSFIQSPCFNLSGLSLPYITFKVFWETEGRFDGANLQYSTNGGTTWRVIGDANQPTDCLNQNWYNTAAVTFLPRGNPSPGWAGSVRNNVGGALCTTCQIGGGSGQWLTAKITLPFSSYPDLQNATNVRFRFTFGAGTCCNGYDGFAIDDFTISQAPAFPAQPAATSIQPTCIAPTGSINITALPGETYSFNEGAFTTTTSYPNLVPGNYTIIAQNSFGCNSQPRTITISAPPGAPALPTATVTQPTCVSPTGGITINGQTGFTYSVNGGPFTSTLVYSGFAPGSSVTVKARTSDGCESANATINIGAIPGAPAQPTVSIIQPTCAVGTGTININAVSGIEYSFNGGPFGSTLTFANLAPGSSNTVIARNTAGCTSQQTFTVGQLPTVPAAPTTSSITQPDCVNPLGSFTIASVSGASYSVNNSAFTSALTYSNLVPGTYAVRYQTSGGCISNSLSVQIIAAPNAAEVPVVTVDQPTCLVSTATIRVVSQAGYTYSLNNGPFINNLIFTGLNAGTTNTIRGRNTDGCITTELQVVIASTPAAPPRPDVTITQPDCATFTGSILINAQGGGNLEFSSNGLVYQSNPQIQNLSPGLYNITVRDNSTGCVSSQLPVTLTPSDCTNEIFIPNLFSPNNDGKNDRFFVYGNRVTKMEMRIYNQWGQEVMIMNNIQEGWDGNSKGKPQPAGVYVYLLRASLSDGTEVKRKGSITLIR